jgi:hypothetical protein
MKTKKFFALAAIVGGFAMSFTACSNEDNPIDNPVTPKQTVTISFEGQALNADGYWCGDETGTPFDNWGSPAYSCFYTESDTKFVANYTPAWASWSGFAISNRTATTFSSETMTPDQFNCIAGGAHSGDNFCVVYTFGESIEFEKPVTLKGFWYTNNAWTVDAILNGDGMTPGKFDEKDWLSCYIMPTPADGSVSGARYEISLAKDGDYVKEWKYCDLSNVDAFKNIKSLSFAFDGTKKNDWGVTTPTYICIDDIVIEK